MTVALYEEEDNLPIWVARHHQTKYTFAHTCDCKGTEDPYIAHKIANDMDELGFDNIVLRTDGEPAIVQLQEKVKAVRATRGSGGTVLENTPKGQSKTNGTAEKAVQEIQGQCRALLIALSARLQREITTEDPLFAWMVEYSATLLN